MGGGSEQKSETVSQQQSETGPWKPSQPLLKDILAQAEGLMGQTGLTGAEEGALTGLETNAQNALGYTPQIQGLIGNLFQGGGLGEGADDLRSGLDLAQRNLTPIAEGEFLDQQNPYLQGILSDITDRARNAVGGQFAKAGRSFSGAHANTTADAITSATAPLLFDQYNRERGAQTDAITQLLNAGFSTSGALDETLGRKLAAQTSAPGMIGLLDAPYQSMLSAAGLRRGLPIQNLGMLSDIILPIASLGSEGESSGTSTTTQTKKDDPLKTGIGAALGVAGLLTGNPMMAMSGFGGAAGGGGGGLPWLQGMPAGQGAISPWLMA